jgi:hypothetical protein
MDVYVDLIHFYIKELFSFACAVLSVAARGTDSIAIWKGQALKYCLNAYGRELRRMNSVVNTWALLVLLLSYNNILFIQIMD